MSMSVANSTTHLQSHNDLRPPDGRNGGKSGSEKTLIAFCAGLTAVSIGLLIALIVIALKEEATPEFTVCKEPHCYSSAGDFMSSMDFSVDPCEDFHNFVCGNWVKRKPIPEDKGRYGIFDDLRDNLAHTCIDSLKQPVSADPATQAVDKARVFYQSCVETEKISEDDGVKNLRGLLTDVGIPTGFTELIDVYTTLSSIVSKYGLNFILSFGIGTDVKNPTTNIISLDQPSSFGLGRDFLVKFDESNPRVIAYQEFIESTLCLLDKPMCGNLTDIAKDIIDFEVKMANLTRAPTERRNASSWYHPMNISELEQAVPDIPFRNFIKVMVPTVNDGTVVIVREENYFREIASLITITKQGVVSNYLTWRLAQSLGPSLFKSLRDIKFTFDKVNLGIQKAKSNEDRCFDLTNSYFGDAVGRLYIDKGFDEDLKKDVETMVIKLEEAFRELVHSNNWMDGETKTASINKLNKMVDMIGYPDWTKNNSALNSHYAVSLQKSDFFGNLKNSMLFSTGKVFKKINIKNDRQKDWISAASIVNAFYSPTFNSITFPAGILQIPFYGKRMKVLNYGAIGYVIGHEITHGFDDSGRQYDGDGSLNNWWTPETLTKFTERRDCFINQYSSITDELSGLPLNGKQTIGENIADNGGIRESFKAYFLSGRTNERLPGLEQFDDKQLFYISAGTIWCSQFRKEEMVNQINQGVHSPGMYRAYVPLANDEEFAKAFKCKEGSKMNPKNRCTIW